jgi:hypothetical protein
VCSDQFCVCICRCRCWMVSWVFTHRSSAAPRP